MILPSVRNTLAVVIFALAACAVGVNAQQPAKTPTKADQASGKEVKTPPPAESRQPAAAGGVVVFIDPATGQVRQPSAEEIGTLSGTSTATGTGGAASPTMARRPSAQQVEFRGPDGAVGVKLGDDSMSYMVVTKTPDGNLAEACVTGSDAAAVAVSKGVAPKTTAAPKKAKEVWDEK